MIATLPTASIRYPVALENLDEIAQAIVRTGAGLESPK